MSLRTAPATGKSEPVSEPGKNRQDSRETSSARAETKLVESHLKFAHRIASRYFLPGSDRDDVRQEAAVALIEAVRAYQPGLGEFRPFAATVIRRRLFDRINHEQRDRRRANHETVQDMPVEDDEGLSLIESLPAWRVDPADVAERREELARVARGVARLSPLEKHWLGVAMNGGAYAFSDGRRNKQAENAVDRARNKLREAA